MRPAMLLSGASRWFAAAGLLLISVAIGAYLAGARANFTASLPLGLYWTSHEPMARGVYVRFCPPAEAAFAVAISRDYFPHGRCDSGYMPLIKRISGIGGDRVTWSETGVSINGVLLPLSRRLENDAAGRALPALASDHFALDSSQLWVMSDTNGHSFDSRYFGPIKRSWAIETLRPVLTWGYGGTLHTMRLTHRKQLESAGK